MVDDAKRELDRLFKYQIQKTGRIPHQIYGEMPAGSNWRKIVRFYPLYKGWRPESSPYAGAPVIAQAVRAIDDKEYFLKHAQGLVDFYRYFTQYRDPDEDGLISVISTIEGGRDSSPEFDFFRIVRLPFSSQKIESFIQLLSMAWLELRHKLMGWDEKKILQGGAFDVQDLAIQCIWIDGLYDLQWMLQKWDGGYTRYREIEETIEKAEQAVFTKCWHEEDKAFYSMRNGSEHLRALTVASLFPLLLRNLPEHQKQALLRDLKDPSKFWSKYPVPSVAMSHPEFSADRTWPIWRGPTWINTNWFIIRGLVRQGHSDIARTIARRTETMVEREGFWEFYNPHTGAGMRIPNFGWTTLASVFDKYI